MIEILASTEQSIQDLLGWLQREEAKSGVGFYCNRDTIVASHAVGEVHCGIAKDEVVGFVVHTATSARASVDILEVHPQYRRRGVGTQLALDAIKRLDASPAPFITVQCCPQSSAPFWPSLGFFSPTSKMPVSSAPMQLALRNHASHQA